MNIFQVVDTFVALDDACGAKPLPVTNDFWEKLSQGRLGTFSRLVSAYTFTEDWSSWEKHPAGEEFVCLLEGDVEFVLEQDGSATRVALNRSGSYILVPANTWHTAKIRKPSKMLFITPGEGTEHKPAQNGANK